MRINIYVEEVVWREKHQKYCHFNYHLLAIMYLPSMIARPFPANRSEPEHPNDGCAALPLACSAMPVCVRVFFFWAFRWNEIMKIKKKLQKLNSLWHEKKKITGIAFSICIKFNIKITIKFIQKIKINFHFGYIPPSRLTWSLSGSLAPGWILISIRPRAYIYVYIGGKMMQMSEGIKYEMGIRWDLFEDEY